VLADQPVSREGAVHCLRSRHDPFIENAPAGSSHVKRQQGKSREVRAD
jgi:hypothetical protein